MTDIELARECGVDLFIDSAGMGSLDFTYDQLTAFASRIRSDERERCAKVADAVERSQAGISLKNIDNPAAYQALHGMREIASIIASAIRSLSSGEPV